MHWKSIVWLPLCPFIGCNCLLLDGDQTGVWCTPSTLYSHKKADEVHFNGDVIWFTRWLVASPMCRAYAKGSFVLRISGRIPIIILSHMPMILHNIRKWSNPFVDLGFFFLTGTKYTTCYIIIFFNEITSGSVTVVN